MKPYQKIDGNVLRSAREYDIAAATEISYGQIVKLTEGLVVAAGAAETGAILGVAAETHKGVYDALNPRANGTKIMVFDDPALLCKCPVPRMTATGGTATTVTANALAAFSADDFNGGYLKLVAKGADSTNTDALGTIKRITDYAYTSTGTVSTFTVASGATACSGDVYELYPPIGFAKGNLDSTGSKLVLTATAALPIKIVGRDTDLGEVVVMPKLHALGVEE